jgi:serine phosphatase RsbU (regulator of sigma subunit)
LTYVDAGHGYALMILPDGNYQSLSEGDGLPLGLLDDSCYAAVATPLVTGARALVISDGIVEQPAAEPAGDGSRRAFEIDGLKAVLAHAPADDEVAAVFDALVAFAGTTSLSDDATAVVIRW